jgi:phosphatidylserine/phosphatidylglycerophosphate/cardiolipin synthase-like enzyme
MHGGDDGRMVVDSVWATIGSTNFDTRSFALNEEINPTVHDRGVARQKKTSSSDNRSDTMNGSRAASLND